MDEENTEKENLEHWIDVKLISKSSDTAVSREKNVIVSANIESRKTLHQIHKGLKHLTKIIERNENSNLAEKAFIAITRHDNKKPFPTTRFGIIF